MSFTVNDPGPEREPEPNEPVVHYDLDTIEERAACGYDLGVQGPDGWSTNPALVTCPACVATLGDVQPAEPESLDDIQAAYEQKRSDWTAERHADMAARGEFGDQLTVSERRTVGLEVLTDELRAAHAKDSDDPLWGGTVAIVCRITGPETAAVDIPEIDTLWAAPYRKPADILSILLRQARMYADGLDGNAGAELLMPGVDVLGALSGDLWAGFTAAVESRWGLAKPGWWVSVETLDRGADPDVEWALVDDRDECRDPICLVRGDSPSWACAVTTVQGRGVQHLDAFRSVMVRIPAGGAA